MLVLSRKKGDALVIDGDIRVVVIDVKGDSIRLGIEAPKQVSVHRQEVFERLAAQRPPASSEPGRSEASGGESGRSEVRGYRGLRRPRPALSA